MIITPILVAHVVVRLVARDQFVCVERLAVGPLPVRGRRPVAAADA